MASGDTLCVFLPAGHEPPGTSFPQPDRRNLHPVLDFDAATDESTAWTFDLPRNYAGGGITATIQWAATSATSGTCRWQAAFERNADADTQTDDADTDSYASAQSAGGSAPSGSAGQYQYTAITFTNGAQMDSIAVGELFRFKLTRDADGTSGTDDMTGDAELYAVELKET